MDGDHPAHTILVRQRHLRESSKKSEVPGEGKSAPREARRQRVWRDGMEAHPLGEATVHHRERRR